LDLEDRGKIFLRNIVMSPNYTVFINQRLIISFAWPGEFEMLKSHYDGILL
jgi:hypothetical protein